MTVRRPIMTKDELEKIIEIITTHDSGDFGGCDTGEDMEWACRSECVEKAVERLKKYFKA
jgi:hypothetical protein